MRQQKKKREFNDLLIPIILVLAVLPFITRLITYNAGFSNYPWYSDFDVAYDFFSYYKSYMIMIIAFVAAIILIPYFILKWGSLKDMKPFIPLGIFSFFVVLSTIFTVNTKSSIIGGFGHFESVFVLLGYIIILIYTYQVDKKDEDYKSILRAFLISLIFMIIIGFFQIIGKDLMYNTRIQKLIIPRSDWKDYIGNIRSYLSTNAVCLTLFNSNFASVYLAMVLSFLASLIFPTGVKKAQNNPDILSRVERVAIYIIMAFLAILLIKTYSRTGLLSFVIILIILGLQNRKGLLSNWKQCCLIGICTIILFVGIDSLNGFRYWHKLTGTIQSFYDDKDTKSLQEILTDDKGVSIKINNEVVKVSLNQASDNEATLVFQNATGEDISNKYDSITKKLNWKAFSDISFYVKKIDKENNIFCDINDISWRFYQNKEQGYVYINDFGKMDKLTKVEHIGLMSLEDIGSGRGYLWSRCIPLLKKYLIIGSGPDTFPFVFPQSDYVGKANNCKTPHTLIEKPHNMFLMFGIQTGVISMIAFIVFYLFYMFKSFRIYKQHTLTSFKARMGLACFMASLSFMISGFFNDSSLQTTPVFIILLGLGMDINTQLEKAQKV